MRQDVVELIAEDGGDVARRDPDRGLAAADPMVVVAHPPAGDRVVQLDDTRSDRALLEVVLFAVDALQLARVAVLVADEDRDPPGESQEAAVQVSARSIAGGLR